MRSVLLFLASLAFAAVAAEGPIDIDPNTKIEGGADVRGSDSKAGEGRELEKKEEKHETAAQPNARRSDEKDKPISERKPRERESEEAARGETRLPPR